MRRTLLAWLAAGVALGGGCRRGEDPSGGGTAPAGAASLEAAGRWHEAAAAHGAAALAAGPERADARVRQAMAAHVMAGDSSGAERFAAACLEKSPSYRQVLFYLGDAQRVLLEHEASRQTLEKLLALEPGHLQATLALAQVLGRLGRHAEAVPLLERALGAPEGTVTAAQARAAALELARSLRSLGRYPEAAERLAHILELDPFDTLALAAAAQVFALLGRQELARHLREEHSWLFQRGHQLSSEDETKEFRTGPKTGSQVRLALQAADRRQLVAAIRGLEAALAQEPDDAALRSSLCRLWLRIQRPEDALRAARGAPGGGTPAADLLALEAESLAALGAATEARAQWLKASRAAAEEPAASQLDPARCLEIHLGAADAHLEPPADAPGAAECSQRAVRWFPRDWRSACAEARAAIARGDVPAALERLGAARQLLPDGAAEPTALRRATAVARGLQGDLRLAARELTTLIRQSPGDLEGFRAFSLVFGAHRQEAEVQPVLAMEEALVAQLEAVRTARAAYAARPLAESGPGAVALGKLLLARGERDRALDLFLLAAEVDPGNLEGLRLAAGALIGPRQVFQRLQVLRRLLAAAPDDALALTAAVEIYVQLGVRLDEAGRLAARLAAAGREDEARRLLDEVKRARG